MVTIFGKGGANKELNPIYLGNMGVNKQEKELYLGKEGVNKQIYKSTLLRVDSIPTISGNTKFTGSPFTTYNKISVKLTPEGFRCSSGHGAVGFSLIMYSGSDYLYNTRTVINVGYSGYYSDYTFTLVYNGYQVMYNIGHYGAYIFDLTFNDAGMSFYLNGNHIATRTYYELNCTNRVPIYGYSTERSTGSNYMEGKITNLVIE